LSLSWFTTFVFAVHGSEKWCITLCSACISTRGRFELVSIAASAYTRESTRQIMRTSLVQYVWFCRKLQTQVSFSRVFSRPFHGEWLYCFWTMVASVPPIVLSFICLCKAWTSNLVFYAVFCFCDLHFCLVVSLCLPSQEFKFIS
jgi:hypothetical protein